MFIKNTPVILMCIATLFVVMGDMRNLVTPIGYWIVWAVWLLAGVFMSFFLIKKDLRLKKTGFLIPPNLISGFFFLFAAFIISAAINNDVYTAYQGAKFVAIALIGVFIFFFSRLLVEHDFYFISQFVIVASWIAFEYARFFHVDWHVELCDGRQGSIVAYPGVLWKAGAFFAPFLIARLADERGSKVIPLAGVLLSAYLVVQDGSRTGFLWLMICSGFIGGLWVFNARRLRLPIFVVGVCFSLMAFGFAWLWQFDASASEPSLLVLNRLSEGDDVRSGMISDGIVSAENCLPFGCGFGTAVSATSDGPMVIHNAFLSSVGDVGLIGLMGLFFLLTFPIVMFVRKLVKKTTGPNYYEIAALMGVAGFAFLMLFHPLSTEMSEWGLYLIMTAWLHSRVFQYRSSRK